MALYFECKVKYDKMHDNGAVKPVNEPYLVDALTFTEAEARITEERAPYISGDFSVSACKKTKIAEIFWDETGDRYYLAKVFFVTPNEATGQEARTTNLILVQASDFDGALARFKEGMKGTATDWELAGLNETPILDVYPLKLDATANKTETN